MVIKAMIGAITPGTYIKLGLSSKLLSILFSNSVIIINNIRVIAIII